MAGVNGRARVGVALLLGFVVGGAQARENHCVHAASAADDNTLSACLNAHIEAAEDRIADEFKASGVSRSPQDLDERSALLPAGSQLGGLTSSLLQTLPALGLIGLGGQKSQSTDPNVGMILNLSSVGVGGNVATALVQPALDTNPRVFPPLAQALRDENAPATLAALERSLDATDSLELGLTLAVLGGGQRFYFGRDARLYSEVLAALVGGATELAGGLEDDAFISDLLEGIPPGLCPQVIADGDPSQPLPYLEPPASRDCLKVVDQRFARHAASLAENKCRELANLDRVGLLSDETLPHLLSNAAQLHVQLRYLAADAVVGARATGLRFNLEMALSPTINKFLNQRSEGASAANRELCTAGSREHRQCFENFRDWMTSEEVSGKLDDNHRLSVYLEIFRFEAIDLNIPILAEDREAQGGALSPLLPPILGGGGADEAGQDDTVSLAAPAINRYRVGLTWGYNLMRFASPLGAGVSLRMEAGGDYSFFETRDLLRNDYWRAYIGPVLSLGRYSLPLQATYQSDSEFRFEGRASDLRILGGLRLNFI